ncbi:hypothetical protein BJF96_g5631 [Verticillium dahliae]|uniref:Uncharacterized protein n=1 Tax=Verticillium dahliae TaxID=27337 RepID=A0AA45ALP9_VERDA|nr:hypothetical protein BJF96_g5631 [Verticillium dahliae]
MGDCRQIEAPELQPMTHHPRPNVASRLSRLPRRMHPRVNSKQRRAALLRSSFVMGPSNLRTS